MNEVLAFKDESMMSLKEVAEVFNVSKEAVRLKVSKLFPGLIQAGRKTLLNEDQVAEVSRALKSEYSLAQRADKPALSVSFTDQPTTTKEVLQNMAMAMKQAYDLLSRKDDEIELLKAKVNEAESFRTVDRYMLEHGITTEWCEKYGLGKGSIGVGIRLSKWFRDLPAEMQIGAVTEVNLGKFAQKVYRMDILDAYFDTE